VNIVDLDGALKGVSHNERIVKKIVTEIPIKVELGGGIRTLDRVKFWLDCGINQVILGTVAIEKPDLVETGVEQLGSNRIIIGIDAKEGLVATHGWQKYSTIDACGFAQQIEKLGVRQFIFTDIKTDGMFTGPNIEALTEFAKSVSANVTASGGIRNINDIKLLDELKIKNMDSVIVGKAIYEKRINLKEAIQYLQGEN